MKKLFVVAATCVAAFTLDTQAQTIVYSGTDDSLNFDAASGSLSLGGLEVTLSANDGVVNATSTGLGINDSSSGDDTDGIDTENVTETLTLSFNQDVTFDSISFAGVSLGDALDISIGGRAPVQLAVSGLSLFADENSLLTGETITITGATPVGTPNNGISITEFTATVIPEPGSLALIFAGVGLLFTRRPGRARLL